jgi:hypothetical protein
LDRPSWRVSIIFLDLALVARLGPVQFEVHVWALDDSGHGFDKIFCLAHSADIYL